MHYTNLAQYIGYTKVKVILAIYCSKDEQKGFSVNTTLQKVNHKFNLKNGYFMQLHLRSDLCTVVPQCVGGSKVPHAGLV